MKNRYFTFLHSCGFSHSELTAIFSVETSAEDFFINISDSLLQRYVVNTNRRANILSNYKRLSTSLKKQENILNTCNNLDVEVITLLDKNYPENLKNIPHTPFILYVRGEIPTGDMFGVVGSRKITEYGKNVISRIIPEVSNIFPIVSGGAAGCDSYAHKACVNASKPTVVVIGTGIDQTYPVSNEKLFNEVVLGGGAIVSIFRIGEPGNPYNFPVRNEIIVGLSRGILVVEAQEKSGSLITAGLALDLGKDLFSVPGNINSPQSIGTNNLISGGEAKTVTSSMSILEEYNIEVKKTSHRNLIPDMDKQESKIYKVMLGESYSLDELSSKVDLDPAIMLGKLSMLELKGVIKKNLMGKYELS